MRSLVIATISLLLLVAIWGGFMYYTHGAITDLQAVLKEEVSESIRQEDWFSAQEQFSQMMEIWNGSKHIYSYFMDTTAVKEADLTLVGISALLEAQDSANVLSELARVERQLHYIHNNELPTLENLL